MKKKGLGMRGTEDKRVNIIIAVVAVLIAIVLAVYSWQVLPEQVSNQLHGLDTGVATIPKFIAVLFPFGISTASAVLSVNYRKQAVVCLVGYAMSILFLIFN